MQQATARSWWDQDAQTKPIGGYRLIPIADLCAAWSCFQSGEVSRPALNAWFACQEMLKRRDWLPAGRTANYDIKELLQLTGGGERRAKRALRELARAGLVTFSSSGIEFHLPEHVHDDVVQMMEDLDITKRGRLVPVPRELVKLLAGGATKARIATAVGHMLRTLHGGGRRKVNCTGLVKASSIAEAFGLSERSVKRERAALVELGLFTSEEGVKQWVLNAHGAKIVWNLDWRRPVENSPVGERSDPAVTLPNPASGTAVSLLGGNSGPSLQEGQKTQDPAPPRAGSSKTVPKKPFWKRLVIEDLRDDARLQQLFESRAASGATIDTQASRLLFFSSAEHALAVGVTNPCGLFRRTVESLALRDDSPANLPRRCQLYRFLTLADEDAARVRIRRLDGFEDPKERKGRGRAEQLGNNRNELSPDARVVGRLRRTLRSLDDEAILRRLRQHDPSWTSERWFMAAQELVTGHQRRSRTEATQSTATLLQGLLASGSLRGAG